MKKILLTIILFLTLQTYCFAQTGVTFLYINGSNNNDLKMKNWYENGVRSLHPCMKKAFETNSLANQYFLQDGNYFIEQEPKIFFWGDRSHNDLSFVEKDLAVSKGFSPWLAYVVRSTITHFLHDAIWIQKYHNMLPVLEDLHNSVVTESKNGNKVVLFGYSAGSFVTYEYLLTRLSYINVVDFFNNVNVSQAERDFVAQHPMKDTCMSALGQDLAVFSAAGHIVPNDDETTFKKDYVNLNNLTDKYCVPNNAVRGIVNFASPLVLFYSDLSDPSFQLTYYNRLLVKYIFEHDMFWLTVNYKEDPLGFPVGSNLSVSEIENLTNMNISPYKGFIYDQSDTNGHTIVFAAHTSYWKTRNNFAKAVARAYVNGYRHHYDDSYKMNCHKKRFSKLNILP